MRINRFLARSGVASRRHADKLIVAGRVKVNGEVVTQLGVQVDPSVDKVEVDGRPVSPSTGTYYLMLHKPPGYLVSARDPHHRDLAASLLGKYRHKVFAVGRLDYDSSGLLLFTNDGELAFRLTHPRFKLGKTYEVVIAGNISEVELQQMDKGIMLDDGPTAPTRSRIIRKDRNSTLVEITMHEGRKRQLRRMFAQMGYPVISLKRIAFGGLKLGNLPQGKFIHLAPEQVASLKAQVGLQ